ncbi:Signal recognition particle [Lasiodiplodia theobromae]|uniref:Signal recognition particle n=1 Tax=Lasiodiplodia theobromae TaxID=45133 RepID=UPI0015C37681|nr:Signal recognition particle [Lasiodiplodia theobromae]KAF4544770.1 Signal recognition particle [Lasiodiplodia theobromae]
MAASTGNSLAALLSQTHLDDHDEILKAANAQLAKSKSDLDAQHVRTVALVKLDRFDDALRQIEQGGDALKKRVPLEHAYALYKTGKLAEAEKVAADAVASSNDGRGARHVLAQATYRGENFVRAADVYKELAARPQDGEGFEHYNDLRINSLAVDAQLQWQSGHGQQLAEKWSRGKVNREDLEAFETAYNAACSSIACGEFGQADVLLKRAKALCLASEDLSEEDKKAEIMPIIIQQIYVLHKLRKFDEAAKLGEEVSLQEYDLSTRHIARINGMANVTEDPNPYLSWRNMQQSAKLPVNDKPFSFQSNILDHNCHVMGLSSNKHRGVASTTLNKISADPVASTSPLITNLSVVNAAAHAKGARGKAGIKELLPLINKRPYDVGLALTIVQIYVNEGNYGAATPLLENFLVRLENSGNPDVLPTRFAPGIVGTLVALYAHAGRRGSVRNELTKAANYWMDNSATKPPPASLLRAAGASLLESSRPADLEQAGKIFSALLAADQSDRGAAAGLVASYASTHPEKIEAAQLEALTPVARLVADVDIDALESAGVATTAPSQQPQTSAKRAAPKDKKPEDERKSKKIRKSRLPKDFDPNKKVDAERWFPMRDRSYYKPKGRKGKLRQAGLTQGGIVDEKQQQGGNSGAQQTGGGGGGGGANKKKKKGKR